MFWEDENRFIDALTVPLIETKMKPEMKRAFRVCKALMNPSCVFWLASAVS